MFQLGISLFKNLILGLVLRLVKHFSTQVFLYQYVSPSLARNVLKCGWKNGYYPYSFKETKGLIHLVSYIQNYCVPGAVSASLLNGALQTETGLAAKNVHEQSITGKEEWGKIYRIILSLFSQT